MKRVFVTLLLSTAVLWSACAMAEKIGVVDMREIFQSSPQVQKINAELNKKFSPQRDKIVSMGKKLQADVQQLERNQSVMDKSSLDKMRNSIMQQEQALRGAQAQFQQTLFAAQNKAMGGIMDKLAGIVKKIAEKKDLDIVLPKNTVLYAKDGMDITSDVSSELK